MWAQVVICLGRGADSEEYGLSRSGGAWVDLGIKRPSCTDDAIRQPEELTRPFLATAARLSEARANFGRVTDASGRGCSTPHMPQGPCINASR